MDDAQKIINFIRYAEKLKTELRVASKSDKNRESVADHCWEVSLILVLIVPKLQVEVDFLKIIKMAIIHDLVEIEARDVPILDSISSEEKQAEKKEQEQLAMIKIRKMLGSMGEEIDDLWSEFENQQTNEAKVLKAIDRLEGQMQFLSEDVTKFTVLDSEAIKKLLEETTELSKVDPFIELLDQKTLEGRKNRIKY